MAGCASEVRTLMPCPLCGRSLIPAPVEVSITFHCKSGHELSLGDVVRAQSAALKCGLEILLAEWGRQHQALISTVQDARKNGHLNVAEIFDRHAKSIQSRIEKVTSRLKPTWSLRSVRKPKTLHSPCSAVVYNF
jgi:hypothetical protein